MMEAMDTSSRFNMNLRDDKRDTPVPFSWIKRSLVCSRFQLRKTKSGNLGGLVGGRHRLIATKKRLVKTSRFWVIIMSKVIQ
jgi:hypothetical protein